MINILSRMFQLAIQWISNVTTKKYQHLCSIEEPNLIRPKIESVKIKKLSQPNEIELNKKMQESSAIYLIDFEESSEEDEMHAIDNQNQHNKNQTSKMCLCIILILYILVAISMYIIYINIYDLHQYICLCSCYENCIFKFCNNSNNFYL